MNTRLSGQTHVVSSAETSALVLLSFWYFSLVPGVAAGPPATRPAPQQPPSASAIMVVCPRERAPFSFQEAEGRLFYTGESAGRAAAAVLRTPSVGDPAIEAALGPIGVALAPVAAIGGAINGSSQKLSAADLKTAEASLMRAFDRISDQRCLRDMVVRGAQAQSRREIFAGESKNSLVDENSPATVLQTCVESLSLERDGKKDKDFRLRITARARVLNVGNGQLLHEEQYSYLSGKALFYDWTLEGALAGTAHTGYRDIAERVVNKVILSRDTAPVVLGAGYGHGSRTARAKLIPAVLAVPGASGSSAKPSFLTVAQTTGSIGVYSSSTLPHVAYRSPVTWKEAMADAPEETYAMLGELTEFPNSVVQLAAFASAIPVSIYKQTVGGIRGISEGKRTKAEAALRQAMFEVRPHEKLAREVAQQLAPHTDQAVSLVVQPLPPGARNDPELLRSLSRGTLTWMPAGHSASSYLASKGNDTALEIQVLQATLKGSDGVNPALALCVDARATLFRTNDGQEICSWPVSYRSSKHHFARWAKDSAKLFREELDRSSKDISTSVVDDLVASGMVAPGVKLAPIIASK